MKIIEAISNLDSLKQNTYDQPDKIRWLSSLDETVKKEIIDQYVGADQVIFNGYTIDTDVNTELLIPAPYDEAYLFWMEAKIDYANGEYGKYNNAMAMFNNVFDAFAKYYAGNNTPVSHGRRFIF